LPDLPSRLREKSRICWFWAEQRFSAALSCLFENLLFWVEQRFSAALSCLFENLLVLGGAALQRCVKLPFLESGFSR